MEVGAGARAASGWEGWLRIGCGSCVFLPCYAALPRLKTRKLCSFNNCGRTFKQRVVGSNPTRLTKDPIYNQSLSNFKLLGIPGFLLVFVRVFVHFCF